MPLSVETMYPHEYPDSNSNQVQKEAYHDIYGIITEMPATAWASQLHLHLQLSLITMLSGQAEHGHIKVLLLDSATG